MVFGDRLATKHERWSIDKNWGAGQMEKQQGLGLDFLRLFACFGLFSDGLRGNLIQSDKADDWYDLWCRTGFAGCHGTYWLLELWDTVFLSLVGQV